MTDPPVSRQQEIELYRYYAWTPYWMPIGGVGPAPGSIAVPEDAAGEPPKGDPRLRSIHQVSGYSISARDGDVGKVDDFVVEDDAWVIRYMVVDTHKWLPGKKVLVSPRWVEHFSWAKRTATVSLQRDQIKEAPPFDPNAPINRAYEEKLYDFYGRPRYWP